MIFSHALIEKLKTLPEKPGIYKYFDNKGTIIYIGKAKNIKKRVSSYFSKSPDSPKTKLLVRSIADIAYVVVDTEFDALLLENNLIKEYRPKYNIELKDDKTFPCICIKKEAFPRIFSTRKIIKDGSEYFGPYSNVKAMNTLVQLIHDLYPIRTCSLNLEEQKVTQNKYKVCLQYHINNCLGPCVGEQTENEYNEQIELIRYILKGNINLVLEQLKQKMKQHAIDYAFEQAQKVKEKWMLLQNFQSKSTIVSPKIHHVDVLTMVKDENTRFVNFLNVINGSIAHAHTIELKTKLNESDQQILDYALLYFREQFQSSSKEVLVEYLYESQLIDLQFIVPKIGGKKQLLELSQRNASFYRIEKQKKEHLKNPELSTQRLLEQVKKDFRLKVLPVHIECFDNSNIQGTNPVSACVVFKNGKPSKKDYRHFNVKTVEGPNDFASMEEAVFRRYQRLLNEEQALPQLIVIDGGKGQLSSALIALEKLNLRGKIAIVGIAKKLEEIFFPGDSFPLYIDKRSESLKLIQHLRNEAHRFGITHHRNKRSKTAINSILLTIDGVGEKTLIALMQHFKTLTNIKSASIEEIAQIVGKAKASNIHKTLNSQQENIA